MTTIRVGLVKSADDVEAVVVSGDKVSMMHDDINRPQPLLIVFAGDETWTIPLSNVAYVKTTAR